MSDVKVELVEIVRDIAKLGPDANIPTAADLEDIGVDSLERVNIFLQISEKYGVEITDDEIDRLVTIDMIAESLEGKLSSA